MHGTWSSNNNVGLLIEPILNGFICMHTQTLSHTRYFNWLGWQDANKQLTFIHFYWSTSRFCWLILAGLVFGADFAVDDDDDDNNVVASSLRHSLPAYKTVPHCINWINLISTMLFTIAIRYPSSFYKLYYAKFTSTHKLQTKLLPQPITLVRSMLSYLYTCTWLKTTAATTTTSCQVY